jgi:hypothetical protein
MHPAQVEPDSPVANSVGTGFADYQAGHQLVFVMVLQQQVIAGFKGEALGQHLSSV